MFRAPHAPELAPQTPARHKPSRPLCDVPPAYWPTPGSPECDRHAANRPHAPAPAVDRAAVCIGERDSQIGDEEEALSLTLSQFYHSLAGHKSQYVSPQMSLFISARRLKPPLAQTGKVSFAELSHTARPAPSPIF